MAYNLTVMAGQNDTVSFIQAVNNNLLTTGGNTIGWLGVIILGVIWFIILLSIIQRQNDPVLAGTGASFICFVLSIPLFAAGLITVLPIFIFLVLSAVGIAFSDV